MAASYSPIYSVSGKYLEAGLLDLMDVDEMLLESFIGSDSVETYFNTDLHFPAFLLVTQINQTPT